MTCRAIGFVAAVLAVAGCANNSAGPSGRVGQMGRMAPDLSLATLEGRQVTLSEYRGKVVVLDFWASWCPPCQESLPHLATLAANTQQRDVVVLAVNEKETAEAARAFLDKHNYALTVARDADGAVARRYGVSDLPVTIVIGRDGVVAAEVVGWSADCASQIEQAVTRAQATKSS